MTVEIIVTVLHCLSNDGVSAYMHSCDCCYEFGMCTSSACTRRALMHDIVQSLDATISQGQRICNQYGDLCNRYDHYTCVHNVSAYLEPVREFTMGTTCHLCLHCKFDKKCNV